MAKSFRQRGPGSFIPIPFCMFRCDSKDMNELVSVLAPSNE